MSSGSAGGTAGLKPLYASSSLNGSRRRTGRRQA